MTHIFEVEDANQYGVEKAVIIYHLRHWIRRNYANQRNIYDGRCWTYNSAEALCDLFPYWTRRKIARLLQDLEAEGVIVSGNYNEKKYDRTKWYAFANVQSIGQNLPKHWTDLTNGVDESVQPIPDSLPNKLPDKEPRHLSDFNTQFWPAYPRKVNKGGALKAFAARHKEGFKIEQIMKCLEGYKIKLKQERTEEKFIMHASTFLNAEHRFLDFEDIKKKPAHPDGLDALGRQWKGGKIVAYFNGYRFITPKEYERTRETKTEKNYTISEILSGRS